MNGGLNYDFVLIIGVITKMLNVLNAGQSLTLMLYRMKG